jgi:drug/metabolite transporter (DMT)-like permease|tara:strand:+ start:44966 stop:45805 length:840 start_codon:yes stop_codon:yes gene_type:complete
MNIPKGTQYMLLATLTFTGMKVFVKYIPHIPAIEIVFFRALISLFLTLGYLWPKKIPIFGNRKRLLVVRGIVGAMALILNYYLLQQIPLAAASTMTYLTPIFTTLLGIYLVKEKVRPIQIVFFLVSFMGVLIIQGFDGRISLIHLGAGLASSVLSAIAYNLVRKLSTTEHPLVIIFYFPLMVLPISAIWSFFVWEVPSGWDWFYLGMVGVSTQMAQYFMTKSYQFAKVAQVASFDFLGIIYAILFGFILFDEYFNLITYLGMAFVLVGVILNFRFKPKV